jgi:cytochrome c-type biogenesis protein CcmH
MFQQRLKGWFPMNLNFRFVRWYWLFALITMIVTAQTVNVALAQGNQPHVPTDDEVNVVARQLYCPVCENIPLDVCPTQACAQWRELIRDKLAQGWNEAQIKQYFVDQYGDRVLATPPAHGLNWLVYIIPPIAILAGIYILYRALQTWKRPASSGTLNTDPEIQDDEYVRRLEDELRRR